MRMRGQRNITLRYILRCETADGLRWLILFAAFFYSESVLYFLQAEDNNDTREQIDRLRLN